MIYSSLTQQYAKTVFSDYTKTLASIRVEYIEPVKIYAATGVVNSANYPNADFTGYSDEKIVTALERNTITQADFDDVMAIKYPGGIPIGQEEPTETEV